MLYVVHYVVHYVHYAKANHPFQNQKSQHQLPIITSFIQLLENGNLHATDMPPSCIDVKMIYFPIDGTHGKSLVTSQNLLDSPFKFISNCFRKKEIIDTT